MTSQMDRRTDAMKDKAIPYDRHQQRQKAAKSFRLKHSTIIIMKGFDKDVGDKHLFSPKLWSNSTATALVNRKSSMFPSLRRLNDPAFDLDEQRLNSVHTVVYLSRPIWLPKIT